MRGAPALAIAAAVAVAPTSLAQSASVSGTVRNSGAGPSSIAVYLIPRDSVVVSSAPDSVMIDQYELRFVPPLVVVAPGSTVLFRNSDPVMHNVFSPRGRAPGFNLGTYPRPEVRGHVFEERGSHVILCHVHPEMAAFVLVLETPYHTVVAADGTFTLADVPPGRYTVRTWHWRRAGAEIDLDLHPGERRTLAIDLSPRTRGGRP